MMLIDLAGVLFSFISRSDDPIKMKHRISMQDLEGNMIRTDRSRSIVECDHT